MTVLVCSLCKEEHPDHDIRPYGKGGTLVCFSCAMKPENKATTDAEVAKAMGLGGGDTLLTDTGLVPLGPGGAKKLLTRRRRS